MIILYITAYIHLPVSTYHVCHFGSGFHAQDSFFLVLAHPLKVRLTIISSVIMCICVCVSLCVYTCLFICSCCVYIFACLLVFVMCVFVCGYIFMYVFMLCMCACACVHASLPLSLSPFPHLLSPPPSLYVRTPRGHKKSSNSSPGNGVTD